MVMKVRGNIDIVQWEGLTSVKTDSVKHGLAKHIISSFTVHTTAALRLCPVCRSMSETKSNKHSFLS